jgi:hypothetical protein
MGGMGGLPPDMMGKLMSDPELMAAIQEPGMMQKLMGCARIPCMHTYTHTHTHTHTRTYAHTHTHTRTYAHTHTHTHTHAHTHTHTHTYTGTCQTPRASPTPMTPRYSAIKNTVVIVF